MHVHTVSVNGTAVRPGLDCVKIKLFY